MFPAIKFLMSLFYKSQCQMFGDLLYLWRRKYKVEKELCKVCSFLDNLLELFHYGRILTWRNRDIRVCLSPNRKKENPESDPITDLIFLHGHDAPGIVSPRLSCLSLSMGKHEVSLMIFLIQGGNSCPDAFSPGTVLTGPMCFSFSFCLKWTTVFMN